MRRQIQGEIDSIGDGENYGPVGTCQHTEFVQIRLCARARFGLGDGPHPKHTKPCDCVNLVLDCRAFCRRGALGCPTEGEPYLGYYCHMEEQSIYSTLSNEPNWPLPPHLKESMGTSNLWHTHN
jgi:hypothetical protein